MPNYCENELTIAGNKEDVQKLLDLIKSKESDFDFDKVIPYPENLKKLDEIAQKHRDKEEAFRKEHGYERNAPEVCKWRLENPAPKDGYNQ